MNRIAITKTILLLFVSCLAVANARQYTIESLKNPSTNQQNIALLSQVQKTIDVNRKSLKKLQWIEVEKNEIIKMCLDTRVLSWETSLNAAIYNDSCIVFQAPTLIGVDSLKAYFRKDGKSHKINLAIGLKYLNFKNEKVLLGFNKYKKEGLIKYGHKVEDPERIVSVTGTYLVDKYPVTNCEVTQLLWDSIPMNPSFSQRSTMIEFAEKWAQRKRTNIRNENCAVHDSAACTILLYQAMKYANARSLKDGLKPYYIFSDTIAYKQKILSKGSYIIGYFDFDLQENDFVKVTVDFSSDGYRLPFYDEWMMFARGGDKKNIAPWGDESADIKEVQKYALFDKWEHYYESEPVGQLTPNGYGLYDFFGLVWEHVLFEEINPFLALQGRPSCAKGGDNHVTLQYNEQAVAPYWKHINYGYNETNYNGGFPAGFRLIRNIGNNAKWKESKTNDKQ